MAKTTAQEAPASTPDDKGAELAAQAAEATDQLATVEYGGATYQIDKDAVGDVELIEALADYVEDGNALMLPRIVKAMIGPVQYAAFKTAARNPETGRVPMTALRELFRLIDDSLGE